MDYTVKVWDQSLSPLKETHIEGEYHLCMRHDQDNIFIGSGSGIILVTNQDLEIEDRIKVSRDAISDILVTENSLIVAGHSGVLTEIDKKTK